MQDIKKLTDDLIAEVKKIKEGKCSSTPVETVKREEKKIKMAEDLRKLANLIRESSNDENLSFSDLEQYIDRYSK